MMTRNLNFLSVFGIFLFEYYTGFDLKYYEDYRTVEETYAKLESFVSYLLFIF